MPSKMIVGVIGTSTLEVHQAMAQNSLLRVCLC